MYLNLAKPEQDIVHIKLQEYLDKLQHDLRTRYDGSANFDDAEDGVFLRDQIIKTNGILRQMESRGYQR